MKYLFNNDEVYDYSEVKNYKKEAKELAAGDRKLKELLMLCFEKNIKFVSCSRGYNEGITNKDLSEDGYISFTFNGNENYFAHLLSKLSEMGCKFVYEKDISVSKEGIFTIAIDYKKLNQLNEIFDDIATVIRETKENINYYNEMDNNLHTYFEMLVKANNDQINHVYYEYYKDKNKYIFITSSDNNKTPNKLTFESHEELQEYIAKNILKNDFTKQEVQAEKSNNTPSEDNFNKGKPVKFNEINDYNKAANDFAEGSESLKKLLLLCFGKGIETKACCKGHTDEDGSKRRGYISFEVKNNIPYLMSIFDKLYDLGYNIGYDKSEHGNAFIINETDGFDNEKMFETIADVIAKTDINNINYDKMDDDKKEIINFVRLVDSDPYLDDSIQNKNDFIQINCQKDKEYGLGFYCNNTNYRTMAFSNDFINKGVGLPFCVLEKADKEEFVSKLKGFNSIIRHFDFQDKELEPLQINDTSRGK